MTCVLGIGIYQKWSMIVMRDGAGDDDDLDSNNI